MAEPRAKRTAKNSVFLDIFDDKKHMLELYRTLHPEDLEITEDSLTNVTINPVLTDNLYNDLGFIAHDRLMILVEAQSTWTVNILVRILLYLAESYHEYFIRTNQNLYGSKKLTMPKPELYVIYTGERKDLPDMITLSGEYFNSSDLDIEIRAKVICEKGTDDIINQYILFCKVFNEQSQMYGMTKKAVQETIRICKDRNVLKAYLENRESEVVTIMMTLFDDEQVMKTMIRSERKDAEQELAAKLIMSGKMTPEELAAFVSLSSAEELRKIKPETT